MSIEIVVLFLAIQVVITVVGFTVLYIKMSKGLPNINGSDQDLKLVFFDEIQTDDGLLKKSYILRVKQQVYYKNIPIGSPSVLAENRTDKIDREQVDKYLKSYVEPFLKIGKAFVEIKSGDFFSKFKL